MYICICICICICMCVCICICICICVCVCVSPPPSGESLFVCSWASRERRSQVLLFSCLLLPSWGVVWGDLGKVLAPHGLDAGRLILFALGGTCEDRCVRQTLVRLCRKQGREEVCRQTRLVHPPSTRFGSESVGQRARVIDHALGAIACRQIRVAAPHLC